MYASFDIILHDINIVRARNVAQLVECLFNMHKALAFIPSSA